MRQDVGQFFSVRTKNNGDGVAGHRDGVADDRVQYRAALEPDKLLGLPKARGGACGQHDHMQRRERLIDH